MTEELTAGTEGQSSEGTTGTTSEGTEGQSGVAETEGTTSEGTQQISEETFFDPRSIEHDPNLVAAYKQMQGVFTSRMQELSKKTKDAKQKIDAYDAFYQDPLGQIQQLAGQMGYQLTRAQAREVQHQAQTESGEWEPKSWDEVLTKAKDLAKEELRQEFAPMLGQVKELRENNLERFMDDNFSDWRLYEDEMMENLNKHKTLVNDPTALYRMSVPPEVLESKATQNALKKLQTKAEGSKTSGGSTTKSKGDVNINKARNFDEAVKFAQEELARKGITKPL